MLGAMHEKAANFFLFIFSFFFFISYILILLRFACDLPAKQLCEGTALRLKKGRNYWGFGNFGSCESLCAFSGGDHACGLGDHATSGF